MKNIFTLVGMGTTLLVTAVIFFFVLHFYTRIFSSVVRFGRNVVQHVQPKQYITDHLPDIYHNKGGDSEVFQQSKEGFTVTGKLGSDSLGKQGYLMIKVAADKNIEIPSHEQNPMNIAIVVDRSGSMSGAKLDSVKQALLNVSSMFSQRDTVSLVAYDDKVNTLYSGSFNRERFNEYVREITSGGGTNLEGGLKEGLRLANQSDDQKVMDSIIRTHSHVLLLSDGLANVGVSSPSQLASMVEQYKNSNITVSTIGVGSDYDENVMTQIAIAGRGHYYFMESPTQAEQMFKDEFQYLGSTVYRNIDVHLNLENGFQIQRGVGYEMESKNLFRPHDLSVGTEQKYIFELANNNSYPGRKLLGSIVVNYQNVRTGQTERVELPIEVDLTLVEVNPLSDDEVYAEYMRSHVAEKRWEVDKHLEEGNNDEAVKVLDAVQLDLKAASSRLPQVFSKELEDIVAADTYVEAQGSRDVQETPEGRNFKKQNQVQSFSVQYNR